MKKHKSLSRRIDAFARDSDWEHFRSPKNVAMALSVEAGELLNHFLWLTQEESAAVTGAKHSSVKDGMADVFIYLVRLADELGVHLYAAAESRIADYERRLPAEKVRGIGKGRKEAGA